MAADPLPTLSGAEAPASYWLTRFVYLRAIGFIYSVAFLVLYNQLLPLIGSHGLLPAALLVESLRHSGSFWTLPTLFWFGASDHALLLMAAVGLALSALVLAGLENAALMAVLWVLYMSFVHIGQDFYGYGWEILLLEAGFLSIFLCPLRTLLPLRDQAPPPFAVIWLLRWLLFRVMFGAGLIKIRGDACWRDLTCLAYHYETQPVPHPLSWLLHQAPLPFHKLGTLFNHVVELVVPWFLFSPRRLRHWAGVFIVLFQGTLILTGNLSFLNWLTLAVCVACFDDLWLAHVLPQRVVQRAQALAQSGQRSQAREYTSYVLGAVVLLLSYAPIENMLSPHQRMNTSFDPLHLVNSYGAFGSIGKTRDEVILQGTSDAVLGPHTGWLDYEFPCKPGDVMRRPCLITPYHYRLDWQMWFAALSDYRQEPWIVHLVYKLLRNDKGALSLMAHNPFPGAPPRYIRAERYRYRFTRWGDGNPAWWQRQRVDEYLPPLSLDNPSLREFLGQHGWLATRTVQF